MKVAVIGAGKLGRTITAAILGGDNEVTLIDKNAELLETISSQFDLLTICADGKQIDILKEIQVHTYDFLVAVTDFDEKNIVIGSFAKKLGCPNVIARVRDPEHVNQREFIQENMGIDYIVNPDLSIATEIFKYLVEKYAISNGLFSNGKISMIEFASHKLPDLIDSKIKDTEQFLENMLIIAISRNGKIIVPNGETTILENDILYVLGEKEPLEELNAHVHETQRYNDLHKVMIIGGGKSGYFLAKQLSEFGVAVKIIEQDRERCDYLSEKLNNVMILHGDATDQDLLMEENLDDMDAFVTLTGFDEENLLLALLASSHKIEDVVAKVSRKSYADLIERLGVSMALNPLDMTVTSILRYIQGSKRIVSSHFIHGQAEFLEIIASEDMDIINKPLSTLNLPSGVLFAAINRGDDVIVPKGKTRIKPNDRIIILCLLTQIASLEKVLKIGKFPLANNIMKQFQGRHKKTMKHGVPKR